MGSINEKTLSNKEAQSPISSYQVPTKKFRDVTVQTDVSIDPFVPLQETCLASATVQSTSSKQPRFPAPSYSRVQKDKRIDEWDNPERESKFSRGDRKDRDLSRDPPVSNSNRQEFPKISKDSWGNSDTKTTNLFSHSEDWTEKATLYASQTAGGSSWAEDRKGVSRDTPVSNGNRQEFPKVTKDSWDNVDNKTTELFPTSGDWTKTAALYASQIEDTESTSRWVEKQQSVEYVEKNSYDDFSSEKKFGTGSAGGANRWESGRSSRNEGRTCRKCGQEGHFARECPESGRGSRTCHTCGQEGHLARECPDSSKNGRSENPW